MECTFRVSSGGQSVEPLDDNFAMFSPWWVLSHYTVDRLPRLLGEKMRPFAGRRLFSFSTRKGDRSPNQRPNFAGLVLLISAKFFSKPAKFFAEKGGCAKSNPATWFRWFVISETVSFPAKVFAGLIHILPTAVINVCYCSRLEAICGNRIALGVFSKQKSMKKFCIKCSALKYILNRWWFFSMKRSTFP